MECLYSILEINKNATDPEIKSAYRRLALLHHPDKGGDEAHFKKIVQAYEILSDKTKKSMYDTNNGTRHFSSPSSSPFMNIFDVFNIFQQQMNRAQSRRAGEPVYYEQKVSLEDILQRKIKKIKITRNRICSCYSHNCTKCQECEGKGYIIITGQYRISCRISCRNCSGSGSIINSCDNCKEGIREESKLFYLHLTPDMWNGATYRFKNEGNQSVNISESSDIIVSISVVPHSLFTVEDRHLVMYKEISLKEGLCGYNFTVTHPSGEVINTFIKLTNNSSEFIVKGKGLSEEFDLKIRHKIIFPVLTELQISQLREIL